MFRKVLIANRGEIALRILRACREMGIATVAVHSTADAAGDACAPRRRERLHRPAAGDESYLNPLALLAAAEITGADAIHPGYGFLSENADFAQMVEEHGFTFIGPSPEHIRLMGDKIVAKATAKRAGHPDRARQRRRRSAARPRRSAGARDRLSGADQGRGRRRRARHDGGARAATSCRRRAHGPQRGPGRRSATTASTSSSSSSGPRHIEVQVIGDGNGHVVHLGERDCSLQRRHQKVVEEAPSPGHRAAEQRERLGAGA